MFYLLALLPGIASVVQTSVNAKLRTYVGSPYTASFVPMTVGFLTVSLLNILMEGSLFLNWHSLLSGPWWAFTGGLMGLCVVTIGLSVFPVLGAVQTLTLPFLGQILTGLLIDHYGLFRSERKTIGPFALLGLVLLLAGIWCVVVVPQNRRRMQLSDNNSVDNLTKRTVSSSLRQLGFSVLAVFCGILSATEVAINGQLS